MAIVVVGGEADCFSIGVGDYVTSGTEGTYDPVASRSSLEVVEGASEYSLAFNADIESEFWVHLYISQNDVSAGDYFFIGGDEEAYKIALESDGRWSLYRYSSASYSLLVTSVDPVLVNAFGHIDIHIFVDDTSGEFTVYLDEEVVVTYTGDTTVDATVFNYLYFLGSAGTDEEMYISQVIVGDYASDTRGLRLVTLPPTGPGALSQWSGNYTDVNEINMDDGDYISSLEPGNTQLFAMTDIPEDYAGYIPIAFAIGIAAVNPGDTFIDTIQAAVRVGVTVSNSADSPTLIKDGSLYPSVFVFNADPTDDSAWTKSKVNGAQIGVKSIDNP